MFANTKTAINDTLVASPLLIQCTHGGGWQWDEDRFLNSMASIAQEPLEQLRLIVQDSIAFEAKSNGRNLRVVRSSVLVRVSQDVCVKIPLLLRFSK